MEHVVFFAVVIQLLVRSQLVDPRPETLAIQSSSYVSPAVNDSKGVCGYCTLGSFFASVSSSSSAPHACVRVHLHAFLVILICDRKDE